MPRKVTLSFDDGGSHVFDQIPDDITPEQVIARAAKDFPGRALKNIDGGRGASSAQSLAGRQDMTHTESFEARPAEVDPKAYLANAFKGGISQFFSLPASVADPSAAPMSPMSLPLMIGTAPVRIAQRALGFPEGAGGAVKAFDEVLGVDRKMPAPAPGLEFSKGIAEMAGSGIVPGAAVVKAAPHKLAALGGELMSTALGGIGSEVGGAPGALVGSLSPAITSAMLSKAASGARGAKEYIGSVRDPERMAGSEISRSIADFPGSARNLRQAAEVEDVFNRYGVEFNPTAGAATRAPGMLNIERKVAQEGAGRKISASTALTDYTNKAGQLDKAISTVEAKALPKAGERSLSGVAGSRYERSAAAIDKKISGIEEQERRLTESLPNVSEQTSGQQLRALRESKRQEVKKGVNEREKALYAEAAGLDSPMDDIMGVVKGIYKDPKNSYQDMPPVFQKVVSKYGDEASKGVKESVLNPATMTYEQKVVGAKDAPTAPFEEIHSLWKQANREWNDAKIAGDSTKAAYLAQIKDALATKVKSFENSKISEKLADFNKFYAEKYARPFKEGVGGRMDAKGRYGLTMDDDAIVNNFFSPRGMDDYAAIFGSDRAPLRDAVLTKFRREVAPDGVTIDPKKAAKFVLDNKDTLDKAPDLRRLLSDNAAASAAMAESKAAAAANRAELDKSFTASLMKSKDPQADIVGMMGSPERLKQLLVLGKSPADKATIARSIIDAITPAAKASGIDPITFMRQNRSTLAPILDAMEAGHAKGLDQLFRDIEAISKAKTIRGRMDPLPTTADMPAKPQGIVEGATGSTARGLAGALVNPVISKERVIANFFAKWGLKIKEEQAMEAIYKAIYDPDFRKHLQEHASKPVGTPKLGGNSLMNHLASVGIKVAGQAAEDQQ